MPEQKPTAVKQQVGMAKTIVLVVLGMVALAAVLLVVYPKLVVPALERSRRNSVKHAMQVVQKALEAYAVDHNGSYPYSDADWTDPQDYFFAYFPGGDPIGLDGSPIYGRIPKNPYTGKRYKGGEDLFHLVASGQTNRRDVEVYGIAQADSPDCPYKGLRAPRAKPGTIVVLTWGFGGLVAVRGYRIVGFDRDVSEPMYDMDEDHRKVYFVLNNPNQGH